METYTTIQITPGELQQLIQSAITTALEGLDLTPKDVDRLMTIDQAAEYLNLSKQTLYKKVHFNEIPYSKTGKRLYFLKSDIMNWVKKNRVKTNEEIEIEAANHLRNRKGRYPALG